jgi:hypothetical protein
VVRTTIKAGNEGSSVLSFLALSRGLAHHEERTGVSRELQEVAELWKGFKCVKVRLDRHQHEVGSSGRFDGISPGMRRRVDDHG